MGKVKKVIINNKIVMSIILVLVLVAVVIGVSYSFVGDLIEESQITSANVNLGAMENFTYTKGDTLNLVSTSTDLSASTSPSVTLVAGTDTTTIDSTYNVYFSVLENSFVYSDSVNKPAELLLKITDPSGNEITEVTGLDYVTSGGKSGFDITTQRSFVLIDNEVAIATNDTVSGVTQTWTFSISYVDLAIDQTKNNNKTFKAEIIMKNGSYQDNLSDLILSNNGGALYAASKLYNPTRAAVSQEYYDSRSEADQANYEVTNGLYAAEDDLGTSYFFRGHVDNNWVEFAGFYWRVIRINGDSTVRLIYSGVIAPTEATSYVMSGTQTNIYAQSINNEYSNVAYSGYMYTIDEIHGSSTSSVAKISLEDWYGGNLKYYEKFISDSIFCNDRSGFISVDSESSSHFGAKFRLISSISNSAGGTGASLICSNQADKYSAEEVIGNGNLTFPVGLVTADEVSLSGGAYKIFNSDYYIYSNSMIWTLSPYNYWPNGFTFPFYFYVDSGGNIEAHPIITAMGLRPVISLKADTLAVGSGTWYDPYKIVME